MTEAQVCKRCNRTDVEIRGDICGTCADWLREEAKALSVLGYGIIGRHRLAEVERLTNDRGS